MYFAFAHWEVFIQDFIPGLILLKKFILVIALKDRAR